MSTINFSLANPVAIIEVDNGCYWLKAFTVYDGLVPHESAAGTVKLMLSMNVETNFVTTAIALNEKE